MKKQNGITLIALVITIIVLLILAGVSIAMLTGDNGILNQATKADTATTEAEIADKINMALNGEYANLLAEGKMTQKGDSDATQAEAIQKFNGIGTDYTVEVNEIEQDGTGTVDVLTISKSGKSGKITYDYATKKYTITKAEYPITKTAE